MRRIHLSQSVRGALHNWTDRDWDKNRSWITHDNGTKYESGRALKDAFLDLLAEGKEFIPLGECDNFDFKSGCKGHEIKL